MTVHSIGECRVCTNGELAFAVRSDTGEMIVECLECLTGYLDPWHLAESAIVRLEGVQANAASLPAVVAAGLGDLISG